MTTAQSNKRVSIVDVARMTGLSRSTVDRVLNGREGVRAETKARVETALKSLGYSPSSLSSWRTEQSKRLEIFVPKGTNPFFAEIRKGLEAAIKHLPGDYLSVDLSTFDPYQPEQIEQALLHLSPKINAVITVGVDRPELERTILCLEARGVRVITVVSDVPNSGRTAYIGQDNFVAGRTAGRLMSDSIDRAPGTVAVMLGHFQYRHLLDRQSGFQQIMGSQRPNTQIVLTKPYGTDPEHAWQVVEELVAQHPDLQGVYLAGGGQPYLIEALAHCVPNDVVTIGHELTGPTCDALRRRELKFVLAHDVYEVGRKAVDALFDTAHGYSLDCEVKIYVAENLPSTTHQSPNFA